MSELTKILKSIWGYDNFRPLQREFFDSVNTGADTVALMPTGGGKSLTYQVPTMAKDGICIVITPLIALMKDQVDSLRKRGILAAGVHSGMSLQKIENTLDNCLWGDYKFLYIAPERISSPVFLSRFAEMEVSLIAVDEAHCISEWGYDFRPAYLKINSLRELKPEVPILALTASATPKVLDEIVNHLKLRTPQIHRMSFRRNNLSYVVRQTEDKQSMLRHILQNVSGSAIVYVRSRKRTEQLSLWLTQEGIDALPYHGGMDNFTRSNHQEAWLAGRSRVIVATNAFGMGIDKPDVRVVIHYDLCESLEAYYQEAGRAGRDGKPSFAVLISSDADRTTMKKRLALEFPEIETIKQIYDKIFIYLRLAYGVGSGMNKQFDLHDFCKRYRYFPQTVINAIKILDINGYLKISEPIENPTRIMFECSRDELYDIKFGDKRLEALTTLLLRRYPGVFSEFRAINEVQLAADMECSKDKISELLLTLSRMHIIKYIPGSNSPMLHITEDRIPMEHLFITPKSYAIRKEITLLRNRQMLDYAELSAGCRSLMLQNYFGDESCEPCGSCDLCRNQRKKPIETIDTRIIEILKSNPMELKQLVQQVGADSELVVERIRTLLKNEKITQDKNGIIFANTQF